MERTPGSFPSSDYGECPRIWRDRHTSTLKSSVPRIWPAAQQNAGACPEFRADANWWLLVTS
jgi:hypothetical protein